MLKHIAIVLCLVGLVGCGCPPELKRQADLSVARTEKFVQLMDEGKTTREDEQDYIRACQKMFVAIKEACE